MVLSLAVLIYKINLMFKVAAPRLGFVGQMPESPLEDYQVDRPDVYVQ